MGGASASPFFLFLPSIMPRQVAHRSCRQLLSRRSYASHVFLLGLLSSNNAARPCAAILRCPAQRSSCLLTATIKIHSFNLTYQTLVHVNHHLSTNTVRTIMDLSPSVILERNEEVVRSYTPQGFVFPDEPSAGDLVVGPDVVMQSAAGYYIGQHCIEFLTNDPWQGEWCGPMPYARDTGYMSREAAEAALAAGEY